MDLEQENGFGTGKIDLLEQGRWIWNREDIFGTYLVTLESDDVDESWSCCTAISVRLGAQAP